MKVLPRSGNSWLNYSQDTLLPLDLHQVEATCSQEGSEMFVATAGFIEAGRPSGKLRQPNITPSSGQDKDMCSTEERSLHRR